MITNTNQNYKKIHVKTIIEMTRVNIYKKMNYSNNHTIVGTYIYVVQVTKPENR